MKLNFNKNYTTISVYSFIVICLSIIFFEILSKLDVFAQKMNGAIFILQPFIIGFVIAYLINFILKFYEEKVLMKYFKDMKKSLRRGIGILLSYLTVGIIFYIFMQFVMPQLLDSILGLVNDIPKYVNNLSDYIENLVLKLNLDSKSMNTINSQLNESMNMVNNKLEDLMNFTIKFITDLIPILGNFVAAIASALWNLILGTIVSIYLLIEKEKFFALGKKITYSIFNKSQSKKILELSIRTRDTFGNFIGGKILDSLIIGILTFVVLAVFKMPYTLLISVIIGITNIIPFFGPFLGAIPSAIIILFVSPIKSLWFLLIILVIQQLDGNVIGPKILGDSIGISPFWILFSILVTGKFLGILGMIIGVPMFAIIYSIIKEIVEHSLEKKGLPKETKDYVE